MAQIFTGRTHAELDAFIEKYVNLFNIHLYNLPEMRKQVDKYEKEDQAKNIIKMEEDNEEKKNESKVINSNSTVPINFDYVDDDESTEWNTEQKNENKEEINDLPLFDPAWAYEMRPFGDILSEDKFYEGVSEVETNK